MVKTAAEVTNVNVKATTYIKHPPHNKTGVKAKTNPQPRDVTVPNK